MDITLINNGSVITYHADGTVDEEVIPPYQPNTETITIPVWYMKGDTRVEKTITIPRPSVTDRRYYDPMLEIYRLTEQAHSKSRGDIYSMFVSVPSQNIWQQIERVPLDTLVEHTDIEFEVRWRK